MDTSFNGHGSDWCSIGLVPPLFLIYVIDLFDNLTSAIKLFADDFSLFLTFINSDIPTQELNEDLEKLSGLTDGKYS